MIQNVTFNNVLLGRLFQSVIVLGKKLLEVQYVVDVDGGIVPQRTEKVGVSGMCSSEKQ